MTPPCRQLTVDSVKVLPSAHKHGITHADITHAWENAIRIIEYEYRGQDRILLIEPAADGTLLELVAVPAPTPDRIIHADRLRAKFYDFLR